MYISPLNIESYIVILQIKIFNALKSLFIDFSITSLCSSFAAIFFVTLLFTILLAILNYIKNVSFDKTDKH